MSTSELPALPCSSRPFSAPEAADRRDGPIRHFVDSSGIGGIERHIAVLTKGLRREGHDARVLLLAGHGDNPWLSQLDADDLPYDILDGGFGSLMSLLKREHCALLHTHGYKAGILGRMAAKLARIPIVSTFHAGETGAFPVSLYQRVDEWTSLFARRISVSAPIAKRLPFGSTTIPNFIETPAQPSSAPLPRAVGFVGRLSWEKGPDLFCELAARYPIDAQWHVYGDGPMRRDLERRHGAYVEFHGMVPDISGAWRNLGLLVISSHAEGLPMAALEALAAGVPVAASAVGALPEIIMHGVNGWLFPPGDLDAMGRAFGEWSARRIPQSAGLRDAAWRVAHDRFGAELGVERTLAIYRGA